MREDLLIRYENPRPSNFFLNIECRFLFSLFAIFHGDVWRFVCLSLLCFILLLLSQNQGAIR